MSAESPKKNIKTTQVVFDIIESIKNREGATLSEIVKDIDRSKSTVCLHLSTLQDLGYVTRDDMVYQLEIKLLDFGSYARRSYKVYEVAKPKLKALAEETDERVQLMVENDGRGIYIYRAEGGRAIPATIRIGKPRYLHISSAGKTILANLPETRVDAIIEEWGLPARTGQSITDHRKLKTELEEISEQGFAMNKEESLQGIWAIGAPITKGTDVRGAISISGPSHRLQSDGEIREELPNKVLSYAEEIEIELSMAKA